MATNAASQDHDMAAIDALMAMPSASVAANTPDSAMSNAPAPIVAVPAAPSLIAFASLPPEDQIKVNRITQGIAIAWGIASPATPFPAKYHPDPDPNNWGIPLLATILRLARMTGPGEKMRLAVEAVCSSVERENEGMYMCV